MISKFSHLENYLCIHVLLNKNCRHQKKTNVVECGLDTKLYSKRAMEYLLYGFSNGLILCLLLCDICNKCPYDITVIYILEYFLAIVFSLSTLSCFINYCMYTFQIKPLSGTKHQKKLLSFEDGGKNSIDSILEICLFFDCLRLF